MSFSMPSDRRTLTWTLATGTPKTDYGVANLNTTLLTVDPSVPVWIDETSIRVTADQGSDLPVTAVAIFNHDFDEGLNLRFQMNGSNSWGGPSISELMTVKAPYRNGYACDILLDLTASVPSFRWLSIANLAANSRSIFMGEIWVAGVGGWRLLEPCDLSHQYGRGYGHHVSRAESKKGVQTVYDFGTRRSRTQRGVVRTEPDGVEQLLDWEDDSHGGAYPSVLTLDDDSAYRRDAEPRLVQLTDVVAPESVVHKIWYEVPIVFKEYGYGEVIGA